jgi:hypothetical protein
MRGEPLCLFMARIQFGHKGLLYRLRSRLDARAIDHEELPVTGWEPRE